MKLFTNIQFNTYKAVSALILLLNSLNVFANDCLIYENTINVLGINNYSINKQEIINCCNLTEVTCELINDENHITQLKINNRDINERNASKYINEIITNLKYLNSFELNSNELLQDLNNESLKRNIVNLYKKDSNSEELKDSNKSFINVYITLIIICCISIVGLILAIVFGVKRYILKKENEIEKRLKENIINDSNSQFNYSQPIPQTNSIYPPNPAILSTRNSIYHDVNIYGTPTKRNSMNSSVVSSNFQNPYVISAKRNSIISVASTNFQNPYITANKRNSIATSIASSQMPITYVASTKRSSIIVPVKPSNTIATYVASNKRNSVITSIPSSSNPPNTNVASAKRNSTIIVPMSSSNPTNANIISTKRNSVIVPISYSNPSNTNISSTKRNSIIVPNPPNANVISTKRNSVIVPIQSSDSLNSYVTSTKRNSIIVPIQSSDSISTYVTPNIHSTIVAPIASSSNLQNNVTAFRHNSIPIKPKPVITNTASIASTNSPILTVSKHSPSIASHSPSMFPSHAYTYSPVVVPPYPSSMLQTPSSVITASHSPITPPSPSHSSTVNPSSPTCSTAALISPYTQEPIQDNRHSSNDTLDTTYDESDEVDDDELPPYSEVDENPVKDEKKSAENLNATSNIRRIKTKSLPASVVSVPNMVRTNTQMQTNSTNPIYIIQHPQQSQQQRPKMIQLNNSVQPPQPQVVVRPVIVNPQMGIRPIIPSPQLQNIVPTSQLVPSPQLIPSPQLVPSPQLQNYVIVNPVISNGNVPYVLESNDGDFDVNYDDIEDDNNNNNNNDDDDDNIDEYNNNNSNNNINN